MDTALIVALVGVGGVVLGSAISLTGSIIQEKIKLNNERKIYIAKSMLDKEFTIYQNLNGKFGTLISSFREFCVTWEFGITKDKEMIDKHKEFHESINAFFDAYEDVELELLKCGPFIQDNIEKKYQTIIDICHYIPENCNLLLDCYRSPDTFIDNDGNNKEQMLKKLKAQYEKAKKSLLDAFKEVKTYKISLEEQENG